MSVGKRGARPECPCCGALLGPQHRDGRQWECRMSRCGGCWEAWEVFSDT